MRHRRQVQRPDGISRQWWWTGLGLWAVTLVALTILVARGPVLPSLAASWTHLQNWTGGVIHTRGTTNRGPAPNFTLSLFDDGSFRLDDHSGQVVVVNFWASWCPPCRREAPTLEATYQHYRSRGVVFVGVDIQDQASDAQSFLKEFQISYPNGPDRSGKITGDYGITSLPTTLVIDRQGRIHHHWAGEIQENQLTSFIEEALK